MRDEQTDERTGPDPDSGEPGGGRGRRDEAGGSGVWPASAGQAPLDSEIRTQAEWGQGERGPAGVEDSGSSELFFYEAELEAAERADVVEIESDADESGRT